MTRHYILGEDGKPRHLTDIFGRDAKTYGRFWSDANNRRVAHTVVGDAEVSTVFLALDHGLGHGDPVLWETMIFGGPRDEEQWRYTSREAAIEGHNAVVAELRAQDGEG